MDNIFEVYFKTPLSLSPDSGCSSFVSTTNELFTQDFDLLNDIFVKEKKTYWKKVASSIKTSKEEFLKSYDESQTAIDSAFKRMSLCLQTREQELKMRLQEIGKAKMLEWERQLMLCDEALDWLSKIDRGIYKMADSEVFFDSYGTMLTRDIDFIDSGQIEFEVDESRMGKVLSSVGRICTWDETGREGSQGLRGLAPKFTIGCSGSGSGEFCRPWGVCSDVTGRIFVSDRCNNRIQVFDESGEFLLEFGKPGTKPGEFSRPAGLAVDKKCRIIVADKDNHRIQVFTYSGGFLFSFGKEGHRNGRFVYPWDVAVNEDCHIAVSDATNHRIQLFNEHGKFLKKFGKYGDDLRTLDSPRGLAFRSDGSLLVSDFNNHRIILLDKDFNQVGVFGSEGTRPGELSRPQGVAWCSLNRFAVSDCKNNRIQVFDDKGHLLMIFGIEGSGPGEFKSPQGLCFHPNGNIIVVDLGNDRVQVF